MATAEQKDQLAKLCEDFIARLEIGSGETVYQSDSVILEATDLIFNICEILGYHQFPEEEQ